jgi:excisionase family DNA binding protein
MEAQLTRPNISDQILAKKFLAELDELTHDIFAKHKRSVSFQISEKHVDVSIPISAFKLLKTILEAMAEGKALTLIPSESELSTQQAADMINVSRPYIVNLIDRGELPAKLVGKHRRILLKDLLDLDAKMKGQRKEGLKELAREAQDLNLGY